MIAEANREIRQGWHAAKARRRDRALVRQPYDHLDWIICQLEELHLQGYERVPRHFVRHLLAVREALPPQVKAPENWRGLISAVMDQCFDLQEQLLCQPSRWSDAR